MLPLHGLASTSSVSAKRGWLQSTRSRRRTRTTQASPPAPPKTTPREWTTQDVSKVALKDVPLKATTWYPDVPGPPRGAPKMRVAIVGSGLAGLSTAVELLDQKGHEVVIYDQFLGGKVASWKPDKDGNHIEMAGLHVFFGCYHNHIRLMALCGVLQNLLLKEHRHTFCNNDGDVRELDIRFDVGGQNIGAPFHGLKAFFTTPQVGDKAANALRVATSPVVRSLIDPEGGMNDVLSRNLDNISFWEWFKSHGRSEQSIKRMWDPIAYALGFLDCKDISARCMLTIFQFFATKTDASVLRMLNGSPAERQLKPFTDYIEARGGRIHLREPCKEILFEDAPPVVTGMRMGADGKVVQADAYVASLDVPGAKQLLPQAWRKYPEFDKIYALNGVPVTTVQLRYNGDWVTEMYDPEKGVKQLTQPQKGINNFVYSPDAFFSCFAHLALVSGVEYFHEAKGSLMQVVYTPAAPYMPWEAITEEATDKQVRQLFPSNARKLDMMWQTVVMIGQSLYQEGGGMDPYRPEQATPVGNFFLGGSYTQDYIESFEGAKSGRQCAGELIMKAVPLIQTTLSKGGLPSN
uniref:Zeta-carotene desaturase n=1 Tax=Dunaliella salina TaxID=3046 RepID=E0AE54_DUNSA|nr:chloroplast zeta-carotene desaturase [Dunaliella salina]